MKTSQFLKQCKCNKTFNTKESKNNEICDTCFEKSEQKRLKAVAIQNANKNRTSSSGNIEKIASYMEEF